jgi:hypothetical protein
MFSLITSGTVRHAVRTQRIIAARERESPVPAPSFWGSIAAGTMVVLGICALSDLLMFSGHVGVYRDGAAIWMMITACVAYYGGGLVASRLSLNGTWFHGLVLWGFSIPLSLLVVTGITEAAGIANGHSIEMTAQIINGSGTAGGWAAFISVALGLAFAVLGSTAGACVCGQLRRTEKTYTPPRS